MKYKLILFWIALSALSVILSSVAYSQARVQVIHNSADPAAAVVDVYLNDAKPTDLDNFAFRTATPFLSVPSGVDIVVKVADSSSTNAEDQIIATFELGQLQDDTDYVIMANGVIGEGFNNGDPGNREITFDLYAINGRNVVETEDNFEFQVFHGVTDAPAVDIYTNINLPPAIGNLDYAASSGFVSLPPNVYTLTITAAGNKETVVGTYYVDSRELGNAVATVFASGFLTPDDEPNVEVNDYSFGVFVALADGTVIELDNLDDNGTAQVQVIHNAAVPAADEVDIYINGQLFNSLNDLSFQSATGLLPVPAGVDVFVTIAASNSTDVNDQVIKTFDIGSLEQDFAYSVIASGIVGEGFNNPQEGTRDIELALTPIQLKSETESNQSEIAIFHGVTDAPPVDIYTDIYGSAAITNLNYKSATVYLPFLSNIYTLTLTQAGNKNVVAGTFLMDISELGGQTAIAMASGFLTPDDEAGGLDADKYGFKVIAVLTDGTVVELRNITNQPTAKVQFVHNASVPAGQTVDIYVNGQKHSALNNFMYRKATSFLDVPAGIPLRITVGEANSTDQNHATIEKFDIGELNAGERYFGVASGILGEGFVNPDEENRIIDFSIFASGARLNSLTDGFAEFKVFHGVTDASAIDIYSSINGSPNIRNLDYSQFSQFINLPENEYRLTLTAEGEKDSRIASYNIDLNGLENQSFLLMASGFANPEANSVDPDNYSFGLFAVYQNGEVIALDESPSIAFLQLIHNSALPEAKEVDVYINGVKPEALDNIAFRTATPMLEVPAGEALVITIANSKSTSANEGVIENYTIPALDEDKKTIGIINGVLGNGFNNPESGRSISLNIYQRDMPLNVATFGNTDFTVFHGVTDAPAIEIFVDEGSLPTVPNLEYGVYNDYISVLPGNYELTVTIPNEDEMDVIGKYLADFNNLENESFVVFASGFLTPGDESGGLNASQYGFKLMAAFQNGNVIEIPKEVPFAQVQVIHNSALPAADLVDIYVNGLKPSALDDIAFRDATPFLDVPADEQLTITVAQRTSANVNDQVIATFNIEPLVEGQKYIVVANGVIGDNFINPEPNERDIMLDVYPIAAEEPTAGNADFLVFHGVTDAPAVDIYAGEPQGDALIPNLNYGEYSGVISVPASEYILNLTNSETQDLLGTYNADLSGLADEFFVVFASGFVQPLNQNTPMPSGYGFGLYAALSDGTVIKLPVIESNARVQVIHNSAFPNWSIVDIYINDTKTDVLNNVVFRSATPYFDVPAGTDVQVKVALYQSSNSETGILETYEIDELEENKSYVIIINGVSEGFVNPDEGNRDISTNIYVIESFETSEDPEEAQFVVFHGATDAPAVDVIVDNDTDLISDLDYSEFSDFYGVDPDTYKLTITAAGNPEVVAGEYLADLRAAEGLSGVLMASGFLDVNAQPGVIPQNYDFGLYFVFPDGQVFRLSDVTSVNDLVQSNIELYPNPANDIITFESNNPKAVKIYNMLGNNVMTIENPTNGQVNVSELPVGNYYLVIEEGNSRATKSFVISR